MNDQALDALTPTEATAMSSPSPSPDRKRSDAPREKPAQPSEPGPDQAPHEHPDDPGVHPDGPRRYHDDHATPARMRSSEGVPA